jgi:glucan phosphoethanolaminetransferase (alkaline phosphatase superfamily)
VLRLTFSGLYIENQGTGTELLMTSLPLSILFIIIPVLALITIFLFKNRILQLRLVAALIILIVLSIVSSGYYVSVALSKYEATFTPGVKMVLPVILLILSILAYRGIKKDELLVKSYDRLR